MAALPTLSRLDRDLFLQLADWFVVAVAVVLPWSTTASAICIAAWLLVALPSLDTASVKRELRNRRRWATGPAVLPRYHRHDVGPMWGGASAFRD